MEERKYIDCSEQPDSSGCSLKISGKEEHVLKAAMEHAVSTHGATAGSKLKEMIQKSLKSESHIPKKPLVNDMNAIM